MGWVRKDGGADGKRRHVLLYNLPAVDPKHARIEELLQHIPYGKGNTILLEALSIGCSVLLERMGLAEAGGTSTVSPTPTATPAVSASATATAAAVEPQTQAPEPKKEFSAASVAFFNHE